MLTSYISNLDGSARTLVSMRMPASPEQSTATQVVVPLNDSRTASVNVSMYDKHAMDNIGPAYDKLLWVYYKPTRVHSAKLVFLGPIQQPIWDYGLGMVTLNAHDPSIYAKKAMHRFGDVVVDRGYTVDGRGMRMLWSSTIPSDAQIDRGVKHPGVLWGYDDTLRLPPPDKYLKEPPQEGRADTAIVTRGTVVYQSMQDLANVAGVERGTAGPDWDLVPLDRRDKSTYYSNTLHQRVERDSRPEQVGTNIWYAQLDTYDGVAGKGRRLGDNTQLQYGYGLDNLSGLQIQNEGDQESNYVVIVGPGGEDNKRDTSHRALRHNEAAWLRHGILQRWESSGEKDANSLLARKAKSFVEAYGWAPVFMSAQMVTDDFSSPRKGPRKYAFFDFEHGDRIKVSGKRGYARFFVDGEPTTHALARITQVQLSDDPEGRTQQTVEVVPEQTVNVTGGDSGE